MLLLLAFSSILLATIIAAGAYVRRLRRSIVAGVHVLRGRTVDSG